MTANYTVCWAVAMWPAANLSAGKRQADCGVYRAVVECQGQTRADCLPSNGEWVCLLMSKRPELPTLAPCKFSIVSTWGPEG